MRTQLVPQSSVGRLVSLHVDGRGNEYPPQSTDIPALMPLSVTGIASTASTDDNGEKTMLWTNIANLFSKTDHHDDEIQEWTEKYSRSTNDILQELQDIKAELAEVQSKQLLTSQVRKIKKYVSKKCEKMREDINYGSFNADNEIFAYINKMRAEMEQKMTKLEAENAALREELTALHNTYDNDYNTFVERENDLMSQMNAAVQLAEAVSDRVSSCEDCELTFARRLDEERNATAQSQHTMAGDLREEFVRSITKENEMERKTQLNWLQGLRDELVDLVTRSNEYHSHRYFGLVEQVNKTHDTCQDMCQTLKNSIGMVDAELSDTKEKVEFLTEEVAQANNDIYDAKESITAAKDEIFREMDRDYYDLKDYVKRRVQAGIKKLQQEQEQPPQPEPQPQPQSDISTIRSIATNVLNAIIDPIQIVKEQPGLQAHEDDHVIIMDESMFQSDSDQDA